MLDEMDACSAAALVCFNAAIDNGWFQFPDSAKTVYQHKECYLLAGANTYGLGRNRVYVGRNQIDAATLDRFATLDWGYDEAIEEHVALKVYAENGGDKPDTVKRLITKIRKIRAKVEELGLHHVVSPRASRDGARMLAADLPEKLIMSSLVYKGLSADQQKQLGA